MFKKILSIMLSLVMVLGLVPISAAAEVGREVTKLESVFKDMPEDWSKQALENAVSNGLLNGADGKIMPKENLTRAQMAAVINRAFGAENKADISSFNDVPNEAWFFDEMAKAVHMKTFMGSNKTLNPNDAITREQAFLVIARALKLNNSGEELEGFNDLDQISEWAKDGVYSLIQNGYIKGSNGNINPKGNITRAEFAQLMDNIIKHYINEEGQYSELPEGNIMINVPGVTLKDVTVTGDLIIGDGVGEGDVTLENVEVTGRMIVRGGGENSILIKGNSKIKEITVSKVDGKIRVYAEDGTEVEVVNIDDGKDKVLLQGRFKSVVIQTDTEISIDDAKIDKITLQSPKSNITVGETSTIVDIEIEKEAEESSVKVDGTVTTLTTSASKTTVEGEGTLDTINAEEGSDDSVFTVPDAKVTAEANVLVNETEVKAGEEATINDEGTDVVVEDQPTSSGGSSSGSTTVDVEGISLDKTSITIKLGEGTETITATVNPSNASNKNVNWESSDETIATVSGGVVTPVSEGNTTITAITVDGRYEAVCEVKVTTEDSVVNITPIASNDSATVDEDGTVLIEVLINDTDLDGDTLSIASFTQGNYGTVTQEGNSLIYEPNAEFREIDSFEYEIDDGNGETDRATVNIIVNLTSDLTEMYSGTHIDDAGYFDFPITVITEGVYVFETSQYNEAYDTVMYIYDVNSNIIAMNDNYVDPYATIIKKIIPGDYTITVEEKNLQPLNTTFTIYLKSDAETNKSPVANDDSVSVDEDSTILIDVLVNDSDIEGDTLSITGFTQGTKGTVSQEGDSLRYTPDADYNGADSFTYDIGDGNGGVATATVNVTINPITILSMDIEETSWSTDLMEINIIESGFMIL